MSHHSISHGRLPPCNDLSPTTSEPTLSGISTLRRSAATCSSMPPHNQPSVWERRWWDDRIMAWAMQDESVKVQMFRFVDVLPMLATQRRRHAAPARILSRRARSTCPRPCGWAWRWPRRDSLAGRALAIAARRNAMRHARRFIAGTNVDEVLAAAMRERKLRRAFTLDILGEAVTSEAEADRYLQAYLDLIDGHRPDGQRLARGAADRSRRLGRAAARERLGQALGARQPVRSDRSRGTTRRVGARLRQLLRGAASSGRSSTSTWSRTTPRI